MSQSIRHCNKERIVIGESDDGDTKTVNILDSIKTLTQSKVYRLYPFISPTVLGPVGYYLLDIVAAPLELQTIVLVLPITMDVAQWIMMNRAFKDVSAMQSECGNLNNLVVFGERLKMLSRFSWGTALFAQSMAFGVVMVNPMGSILIDSLSIYGKMLVTLSPMTPMLFTLINHETIFDISFGAAL